MKFHIRIRPKYSLADLDPVLIGQELSVLQGIEVKRIVDDRAADGTSVTIVLNIIDKANITLERLKQTLNKLPKVTASIMDKAGTETDITLLEPEDMYQFVIK